MADSLSLAIKLGDQVLGRVWVSSDRGGPDAGLHRASFCDSECFAAQRMFRRSGRRFADKNMRKRQNREHVPIPKERNML